MCFDDICNSSEKTPFRYFHIIEADLCIAVNTDELFRRAGSTRDCSLRTEAMFLDKCAACEGDS